MSNCKLNYGFAPAALSGVSSLMILMGCLALIPASFSAAQERRSFDAESYLKGMDANKNGKLESSELSGRTESWLRKMGFDTDQTISLKAVIEKVKEDRNDQSSQSKSKKSDSSKASKVPTFGSVSEPVMGFGATSGGSALEASFTDSVIKQVNETLERYDRNRDGMLDSEEIQRGRWGQPRAEESDTNGDGKLSRIELSNRYRAREMYESKDDSNRDQNRDRRDDGNQRDSERRDRDRGRSDSSEQRSVGTPSRSFAASSSSGSSSGSNSGSSSNSGASSGSKYNESGGPNQAERDERYASYAESLIKQYDKDGDGQLNKEETSAMRRPPRNADADKDGIITKFELVDSLSGKSSSESPVASSGSKAGKASERSSSSSFRSSESSSSSRSSGAFGGLDKNNNNQVEMHEFSDDWDEEKLTEFYAKDKNGDGVITDSEWKSK